jgi:eukaryotic-like serine/threonine-protein kinase
MANSHEDDDPGPDAGDGPKPPRPSTDTMEHARTLPVRPGRPSLVSLEAPRFGDEDTLDRYERLDLLGAGGMGEVHLARDRRIGRRVALKILRKGRGSSSDGRSRFFREACVQGQLEHPVIVPVYDMDRDREGAEFFTMKRVSGMSLKDVLALLRGGDAEASERFSRHRLLSAFQQLCLGIDYAHRRGVLHRDLKPGNIMFGDFGEVYVLDWGLAKVLDSDAPSLDGVTADEANTVEGQILGTPGYMPPEQLVGSTALDTRADVYALGAMLFEVLTLEPLHGRGAPHDIIRSTHVGAEARASIRAPERDVPPELEAICVRATALDPAERFANARVMHDAIANFLEGNRDLQLRRELAEHHAREARDAADQALLGGVTAGESRSRALREAGRALALDPDDATAAEVLGKLLLEPPKELPEGARVEMERTGMQEARSFLFYTGLAFLGFFALPFTMLTSGIQSWTSFAWIVGSLAAACAACFGLYAYCRRPQPSRRVVLVGVLVMVTLACTTVAATSGIYGPLFLSPLFAMALTAMTSTVAYLRSTRALVVVLGCSAVIVPTLLEWTGLIPPSYRFEGDTITVLPLLKRFPETASRASLLTANVLAIVFTSVVLWRFSDTAAEMRQRLQLYTWHLGQLVPGGARPQGRRRGYKRR